MALGLVCAAYLASTVGEQLLAPLFPTARQDLHLSDSQGGLAFGLLALAIAVGNMAGGAVLRRLGAMDVIRIAMALTAVGALTAATASAYGQLLLAQTLLGLGAGTFFPAGLQGVALFAGAGRRGMAMGIYGVAFSAGLTVAALFGALGAGVGWRVPFWIGAALAALALVATLRLTSVRPTARTSWRIPWRAVLGLPTIVGSIGAVLQYGVLAFFVTYAVDDWRMSETRAATVLAIGRVVSIAAKVVGGATTDRLGPRASVLRTGVLLSATGAVWVLLPGGIVTYAVAALFAGTVSSIFPAANVMAIERFGGHGLALGAYRSIQIGLGAVAGVLIGVSPVGLRWTMFGCTLLPLGLLWLCRPLPAPASAASAARSGPAAAGHHGR